MKTDYELMRRAFRSLELLPEPIAFDIIGKLDVLTHFPEMGSPLGSRFPRLKGYREVLYKRYIRIIYEFDPHDNMIYVVAIQDCRQKLPLPRALKRDLPLDE